MDKKKIKFLVLVVLYKKSLSNSETLRSLLQQENLLSVCAAFIIWDNSPAPSLTEEDRQELQQRLGHITFVSTPENRSLSSIYNQVLRSDALAEADAILLLDHDSELNDGFFAEASAALAAHPDINLFLPVVHSNGAIVSPADLYFFKGIRWKKPQRGRLETNWKAAINSGMVIRVPYLLQQFKGYDERLAFYGTDTYFMQQYAAQNKALYVLNTDIRHKLNYFEAEPLNAKLHRFREIQRATALLNNGSFWLRSLTRLYLLANAFLQAVKFKSIRFVYDYRHK